MITGMHPWEYDFDVVSGDPEEIATMVISARKKQVKKPSFYNDGCDPYLDYVALRALSGEMEARYKTAGEFLSALNDRGKQKTIPKEVTSDADLALPSANSEPCSITFKVKNKGKGFDSIAGMNELKETLYQDIILPLNDKELYEQYRVSIPNGMLLYGPLGAVRHLLHKSFPKRLVITTLSSNPLTLRASMFTALRKRLASCLQKQRQKHRQLFSSMK
jgi:transitional endoplasmic reticulum ATPase